MGAPPLHHQFINSNRGFPHSTSLVLNTSLDSHTPSDSYTDVSLLSRSLIILFLLHSTHCFFLPLFFSYKHKSEFLQIMIKVLFCTCIYATCIVLHTGLGLDLVHALLYALHRYTFDKKEKLTPSSPTFRAEAGTLVRVTADITAAS